MSKIRKENIHLKNNLCEMGNRSADIEEYLRDLNDKSVEYRRKYPNDKDFTEEEIKYAKSISS